MLTTAIEVGSHRFEWICKKNDGRTFSTEISITVINKNNHNIIMAVFNHVPYSQILDKKNQIEKQLQAVINHRFQLTGLLDRDGRLILANKNVYDMVDVNLKEITGKYLWKLPHWTHSKKLQQEIENAVLEVKGGKIVHIETTHKDKEDIIRDIEFSLTPIYDENGDLEFIFPEGKDITEEKKAKLELNTKERNYREVFNSTSEAIFIQDPQTGEIYDVNQTTLEMFGYELEDFLQLNIGEISAGEQQFTQEEALRKVRATIEKGPQLFEWLCKRKTGEHFWVEVSLKETTIGGEGRVLAVVRNIADRKKIEEERKRFETLSATDGLTGITNRRRFDEVLLYEYNRQSRSTSSMAVVLLDLDCFKLYNDRYGHVNGDKCLIKVARAIAECLNRSTDLVARYGGEEFVCILPETDFIGSVTMAEKSVKVFNTWLFLMKIHLSPTL